MKQTYLTCVSKVLLQLFRFSNSKPQTLLSEFHNDFSIRTATYANVVGVISPKRQWKACWISLDGAAWTSHLCFKLLLMAVWPSPKVNQHHAPTFGLAAIYLPAPLPPTINLMPHQHQKYCANILKLYLSQIWVSILHLQGVRNHSTFPNVSIRWTGNLAKHT